MIEKTKDLAFWQGVKDDPMYRPLMDDLWEKYEAYCKQPIHALPFSEYELFYRNGSRLEYERPYFARRARLNTFALLWLIYREDQYITGLQDAIWAICDEFTWEVPAHLPEEYDGTISRLGLFSCETGFALSEILYLFEEQLHPMIVKRMKVEIDRRIIQVYTNNSFYWETVENNWAAVCAGSIGAAFIYRAPERMPMILPRLQQTMDCFLRSFGEDGACREGLGYWTYGFGFFTHLADLLLDFTQGKVDLFQKDIVRKVASFQHKVYLQGQSVVSFSDGHPTSKCCFGLTNYLQKRFPGDVLMPDVEGVYDDDCFRWGTFLRNFLWMDKQAMEQHESGFCSYYLPGAQWMIVKNKNFAFAAKGGHNQEPHNHNDLGSFQFVKDGQSVLCDLGMGEYTKDYFREKRYEFLVNGSRGHSVPIINGEYQQAGEEYCATVLQQQDGLLELELAKAYAIPALTSLIRRFDVGEDGVTITDTYDFTAVPDSVQHRLVFPSRPALAGGVLSLNGVQVEFDESQLTCQMAEEAYYLQGHVLASCCLVDLIPKQPTKQFTITTKISLQ